MAFTRRCTITVLSSQVTGTLTDFPVLISKTDNDLKLVGGGGYVENSSGYDIRVFSDSALTVAIPFELAFYDGTAGTFIAWAKIASIATSTVYYLGFGDAALNTNASSTSTWRSEYKGVWHGATMNDSTSNATTLTFGGSGSSSNAAGQIAGAFSFNGSGWATGGDASALDISGSVSISCWLKASASTPSAFPMCKKDSGSGNGYELLILSGAGNVYGRVQITGHAYDSSQNVNAGFTGWFLTHAVLGSSDFTGYYNGVGVTGTSSTTGDMSSTTEFQLGARQGGNRLIGSVEEARVYAGVLPAGFQLAEYKSQSAPGSFASYTFDSAPAPPASTRTQIVICG